MIVFDWKRFGGYEVSTKGDKRFSAFNAILFDGRPIECWYQCDVKGFDSGGENWRLGKGKSPLRLSVEERKQLVNPGIFATRPAQLWPMYLTLWQMWCHDHVDLLAELRTKVIQFHQEKPSPDGKLYLSDRFAMTPVNQAHALAVILNEREQC